MSSDTERKASAPQFANQFANQIPQPAVYYFPAQAIPMKATVDQVDGDEAFARALQVEENSFQAAPVAQEEGGCRFRSFFRRRCGRYSRLNNEGGRCCYKDDGRPLGDLTSFIHGLLFGMFVPIFSVLGVFGFESKRLSRTGVLLGNANFFLILALLVLTGGHQQFSGHGRHGGRMQGGQVPEMPQGGDVVPPPFVDANDTAIPIPEPVPYNAPNREYKKIGSEGESHHGRISPLLSVPVFVVALIFFIAGKVSSCRVFAAYRSRGDKKTEEETVKVFSEVGTCRKFIIGFIVSFVFPVFGTALVLIFGRKYLKSRYGAFLGWAVHMIVCGIFLGAHGAAPFAVLAGLVLCQITSVHFKRAIATAMAKEGTQC